ncbi:MAG: protein kinase [Candidatus Aureabacteria bacterium]|nr:protein kinase [Candidatus Auribacterota bacterium]
MKKNNQNTEFAEPNPESILNKRYRVQDICGRGATGIVLSCIDLSSNREVAVKKFFKDKMSKKLEERISEETKLILKSEYLAKAESLFIEKGYYHLVMPFIQGENLRNIITINNIISEVNAVYYSLCLTKAAGAFHAIGMICTDIKPENTMINLEGKAILIDLTCFEYIGSSSQISLGTKPYAAPEFFLKETLSASTDIYSIGVLLFEMLIGNEKFINTSNSWELCLRRGIKPDISDIKKSFPEAWSIIDRAIEVNPKRRYKDAKSLFDDLLNYYRAIGGLPALQEKKAILQCLPGHELLLKQGKYVFGREILSTSNFYISEKHFETDFDGNSNLLIRDLDSSNSTRVNGQKIGKQWTKLDNNDIIQAANLSIKVRII